MKLIINNPQGHFDISGEVVLQGAKNAALINVCLPLLTSTECTIENVPRIIDMEHALDFLRSIGAKVSWSARNRLSIECSELSYRPMSADVSLKTTHSRTFIPLMVARFGEFSSGPSGGCNIGDRVFLNYVKSLESFGVGYRVADDGTFHFFRTSTCVDELRLPFPSFGLTMNAILAAVCRNEKRVVIHNCCQEPEIDNAIEMLGKMGAPVSRTSADTIEIHRFERLSHFTAKNLSDRNVAVTYSAMALITHSELTIRNYDDKKMDAFYRFLDAIGATFSVGAESLTIRRPHREFVATDVSAFLYPEFHSDWQPLVAPLLARMKQASCIEERLFPDRLRYWSELGKMGAQFEYNHSAKSRFSNDAPHAVIVKGNSTLHGATVRALDLRATAALVAAALAARGDTIIEEAEMLSRGYEDLVQNLQRLGVSIREEHT